MAKTVIDGFSTASLYQRDLYTNWPYELVDYPNENPALGRTGQTTKLLKKGDLIGKFYAWMPKGGSQSHDYIAIGTSVANSNQYLKYKDGLLSKSALKDQGVLTDEENQKGIKERQAIIDGKGQTLLEKMFGINEDGTGRESLFGGDFMKSAQGIFMMIITLMILGFIFRMMSSK